MENLQDTNKPVAWLRTSGTGSPVVTEELLVEMPEMRWNFQQPLYTNPPQRPSRSDIKPLTDEEMKAVVEQELVNYWDGEYIDTTGARDCLTKFARAIEAAHDIKGEA